MGNLPEAIKYLEMIQKVTPGYMNSDQMLAQLKTQLQGHNNPEETKNIAELEQKSYLDYQNKNYEKSIDELLQLVKLHPEGSSGYYNNVGMCYLELDKLKEAEKYFRLSIENKNDFSTPYVNLGFTYEKLGNREKAKEYYEKAQQIDPNNQEAKKNLERIK